MAKKGRMKWVPTNVLNEVENIKQSQGINRDVEAMNKLAQYAQVGREAERIYHNINPFTAIGKKKRRR